ncbi:MAG: hypothetical protein H3Z50_00220 [archaeon]|nr:hypothetical protein [archaeon]MCP8305881.1 hypothetical protein [archaeon]
MGHDEIDKNAIDIIREISALIDKINEKARKTRSEKKLINYARVLASLYGALLKVLREVGIETADRKSLSELLSELDLPEKQAKKLFKILEVTDG